VSPAGTGPRWVDHHCHLTDDAEGDELVTDAARAGVDTLVTVGTDLASSRTMAAIARRHEWVFATAGVHPHEAAGAVAPDALDELAALLTDPAVVAVGEAGLDHYYDHAPRVDQRTVFAAQVALAHETGLPLVIHTRDAWPDTFDVLDAEGWPATTIFHCFTGGPDEVRRCLDAGALVSFSGIVTFPSASEVREAAQLCPLDRMLVETDTPYLAPVPHRGKRNRPAWVVQVGAHLADVLGVPVEDLAAHTRRTTLAAYGIPEHPAV
jgi:TatD DNase family protein